MQHVVHNMPEKDLQQMADTLKNAMYKHRITLIISGVDLTCETVEISREVSDFFEAYLDDEFGDDLLDFQIATKIVANAA